MAGFFGRILGDRPTQFITSGATILSCLISVWIFKHVALDGNLVQVELASWITSGSLQAQWELQFDALSAVMLFVVTTISAIVHIYSIGYMGNDPHVPRFMAYLSLFTFSMLMLVTSSNIVQLFFGWEAVGLCSYLLIGFWYSRASANAAAIKAFLVNRIGDLAFALGIFSIYLVFDSVDFETIFALAPEIAGQKSLFLGFEIDTLTLICLLLFVGAMGKSAQIGLHTWLPDAMEAPTPVSALIHAATMVTAGVFLVVRCSPLFELSDVALNVVAVVGASTAFVAASIGLVQNDIKRVIAYSTCSQLGYMFFACGVSAYSAAMFHLLTHAFFKALLFLGAGSIIHAMSDEQDMRKMGGIWKLLPITYGLMWIGSLALAGIPPFSGYFSKDLILESAYAADTAIGGYAFWLGVTVASLTAFYSWRLLFMTFHGASRADEKVMAHIHEAPKIMTWPLYVLAVGAIGVGYLAYDITDLSSGFWGQTITVLSSHPSLGHTDHVPFWVKILPVGMALGGILLAYLMYIRFPRIPAMIAKRSGGLYKFLLNKWYFDEFYDYMLVRPAKRLGLGLWKSVDGELIDGIGPNGIAALVAAWSRRISKVQSGYIYHYAFGMLVGIFLLVTWHIALLR